MNRTLLRAIGCLSAVFLLLVTPLAAQQIYNYTNNTSGAPFYVDPNAVATPLVRVNGTGTALAGCPSGFNSNGFSPSVIFSNSLTGVEFSVSPVGGYQFTLTSFYADIRRNSNGPQIAQYAYSLDSGATWILQGTTHTPPTGACGRVTRFTWDFPDFVLVGTIKVRVYGYSAPNTSGHFQLMNVVLNGSSQTVANPPVITLNPLDQTICEGDGFSFSASATGNPVPTIQWERSTNGGLSYLPIPGATSASYSEASSLLSDDGNLYRAAFTNSGGTTYTTSALFSVNAAHIVNAGVDFSSCYNSIFQLNGSLGGSASSSTWLSMGDGNFSDAGDLNAQYTPGPGDILAGSVSLVLQSDPSGPCPVSSDTVVLSLIYEPVLGPVSGPADVCLPASGVAYSVVPDPSATAYNWFTITPGVVFNGSGSSVQIDFTAAIVNSGSYVWVQATNACGISDTAEYWVRHTIDIPQFITGPAVVCQNTNSVLYQIKPIQGSFSITWSAPSGANVVSSTDTTAVIDFGPSFVSGNVTVTATHLCVVTNRSVAVTQGLARTPGNISGPAWAVCDSTVTYSIAAVAGAVSYQWTVPAGATIIGPSNLTTLTVQFASGFTTGTVSVVSVNSCGLSSSPRNLTVRGAAQAPVSITGPSGVCANQAGLVFTCSPVAGAYSYSWTVPSTATLVSGQGTNSIVVNWGSVGGNVNVRAVRPCATSSARSKTIAVTCRLGDVTAQPDEAAIFLYPNPAGSSAQITWGAQSGSLSVLELFDLTGRKLMQKEADFRSPVNLNLSLLPRGMYLVRLQDESGAKAVKRLIKE